MADALCGPSNALQNFQKHSTADRTLQQDRLTARPPPSQGFRSSPGDSAGTLDPEFEAFQAGQIPLPHPEAQQFHSVGAPNLYAPQQLSQPAPTAWASDFQQLRISSRSAQLQQHNYAEQLRQQQLVIAAKSWQNEHAKQRDEPVGPSSSTYTGYNSTPFKRLSTIAPVAPLQGSYGISYGNTAGQIPLEQAQAQAQPTEAFDEEAFARAFDQAAQSELAMEMAQQQSLGVDQDVLVNESAERLMGSDQAEEQLRLGADLIHDSREGEKSQEQDDPNALARTAGQLLDSVKDNQSDKFQKSQFLELMRQLRDREVTVEGDKIVGVRSEEEERDALEKSLHSIARHLSHLDFARVDPLLLACPPHPGGRRGCHRPHSIPDQLALGAFIRSLTHASAALDALVATHPDALRRAQPFGLRVGVEVFALAAGHPLVEAFPGLAGLARLFRDKFREVGIEAWMVRRAREAEGGAEGRRGEVDADADADADAEAEVELRAWLAAWLAEVGPRRARGAEWLLSAAQVRALLGPDVYPLPGLGAAGERRPSQRHLDCIVDILGPQVLAAMVLVWMSPLSGAFVNGPAVELDDFVGYAEGVREWLPEAEGEGEEEMQMQGLGLGLELESLFPMLVPRVGEGVSYEEEVEWLVERSKEQWGRAKAVERMMKAAWKGKDEEGVGASEGRD